MAQTKTKPTSSAKMVPTPGPKAPPTPGGIPVLRPLWEYTIMALGTSLERQINELSRMGALGWELVSIVAPGPPHGGLSLAYLERPSKG